MIRLNYSIRREEFEEEIDGEGTCTQRMNETKFLKGEKDEERERGGEGGDTSALLYKPGPAKCAHFPHIRCATLMPRNF